jgi:hypothetical protein
MSSHKPGDPKDHVDCQLWTNCITDHEALLKDQAERYENRVHHVMTVDIPHWQNGTGDWHTILLLALIAKSDLQNRERHRRGFPAEVEAYERWWNGPEGIEGGQ